MIGPLVSRWTAMLALVVAIAGGLPGCSKEPPRFGMGTVPELSLPTLDGRRLGPADYRGSVVILDFMATWCAPCVIQNDILLALEEEYVEEDLRILAVDSGESFERVRDHFAGREPAHPILVDSDGAVAGSLGVMNFPTLLLLDRKGKVVEAWEGLTPPDVIREALGGL